MKYFILYDKATGKNIGRCASNGDRNSLWETSLIGVYESHTEIQPTHIINNEPVNMPPPPPTEAEIIQSITDAIQLHLDSTARQRNYDGILSLCSYAASTKNKFKNEGVAGVKWRDDCWEYSYQVLADVQAGRRTIPTPEELVAELPEMVWP